MKITGLNELRESYLDFFKGKDHLVVPSFSLVPKSDPSILLINAGMTPLKPYFTGEQKPPSKRMATCQKCIRTLDIERVGKTSRHGTFFEMLGNFSFGDYFKKEAIEWSWEYITKVLRIPIDKLWVSVYEDDDEAFEIWENDIGIDKNRIVRLGKEDNFWEHGTGPCGPSSEIHYDRGVDKGCGSRDCAVGCDCDRFMEFWNLVFTQFNKHEDGSYTKLERKNIDTGLGLDRLAALMQGVDSLFEVDVMKNILKKVCDISGKKYNENDRNDFSIRVVTDHVRSTVFMIADGVIPSNEGRGYVLRRLLRRAARHGRLLGIQDIFLHEILDVVIDNFKGAYPELSQRADYIKKTVMLEEERFGYTIDQGLGILNDVIKQIRANGLNKISGEAAFKLHDTYGFPLDLTKEIGEENGLSVDEDEFNRNMEEQKEMARAALRGKDSTAWAGSENEQFDDIPATQFSGYKSLEESAVILSVLKNKKPVTSIYEGEEAVIITDKTCFYAESGGQTGDTGLILVDDAVFRVKDAKKTENGVYLHIGVLDRGKLELESNKEASMIVDKQRRKDTERNHTTTHLLHKALKEILGDHVSQAGSLVDNNKLRFDFTHPSSLTDDELQAVEAKVNKQIMNSLNVLVEEMSLDSASKKGATALFGDKYGESVRVVTAGDYSMELCGGTHLNSTSEAGLFKVISEAGVAAGIRRIEALTGEAALKYLNEREDILLKAASVFKTTPGDMLHKAEGLIKDLKEYEKEIERLKNKLASGKDDDILKEAVVVNDIKIIKATYEGMDMVELRNSADRLKNKAGESVIILASIIDSKVNLAVTASAKAVSVGAHSGNIIKEAAKVAGGGGGGRPDMAQAGGKDVTAVAKALDTAVSVATTQINGGV